MGKIKLAVIGTTNYLGRLAECLQKNAPEYLQILTCKGYQELPGFLARMQPDMILCDEGTIQNENLAEHIVQIYLADHKDVGEEKKYIFRYQRGSEILRQIFQIYEQNSKKSLVCRCKTAEMEMTAFYAPGGHDFLLPFSVCYASLCGEKEKVLYLDLSEFSGMRMFFSQKDKGNFSDLIFGIRQKKERFLICLQGVLHHTEQFDYVFSPENPEDLYEIQEEYLACLLSLLQEQTEYKKIIWNCGTLNQAAVRVMECCGKVFCLVRDNVYGKYRKQEFEKFLQKELYLRLRKKVLYISPQIGSGAFVQGTDMLTQLRSGEFAKHVKKITEETTNE